MAEPENHTLYLLREFREEMRDFRAETRAGFDHVNERIDALARILGGETALARYAVADVDQRVSDIERRPSALEKR